jgi:hypothetical protein
VVQKLYACFWKTCFSRVCLSVSVCVICVCVRSETEKRFPEWSWARRCGQACLLRSPPLPWISLFPGVRFPSLGGQARTMGCGAFPRTWGTHLTNPRRGHWGAGPAFRAGGGGRSHLPAARGFFVLSRPGSPASSPGRRACGPPGSSSAEWAGGGDCRLRWLVLSLRLPRVLARAPSPCPRPPTSLWGDSRPWRAGIVRDLGRGLLPPGLF